MPENHPRVFGDSKNTKMVVRRVFPVALQRTGGVTSTWVARDSTPTLMDGLLLESNHLKILQEL